MDLSELNEMREMVGMEDLTEEDFIAVRTRIGALEVPIETDKYASVINLRRGGQI